MRPYLVLVLLSSILHCTVGVKKVVVIGDWGQERTSSSRPGQEKVARAMGKFLEDNPDYEYIVNTGDNFYSYGVMSPDSERFDSSWREVYWLPEYPVMSSLRWYQTLGNHDHDDDDFRELHQVTFHDRDDQWYLPELWYDFLDASDPDATVHWVLFDSQSLRRNKHDREAQTRWIEDTLEASTADYLIVVGHHPTLNAGYHGESTTITSRVLPPMEAYGADVYVCGHDHNLQHINITNPEDKEVHIDFVISGGGGRSLYDIDQSNLNDVRRRGYELRHFDYDYGIVTFDFDKDFLTMTFLVPDSNENMQESYKIVRPRKRNLDKH